MADENKVRAYFPKPLKLQQDGGKGELAFPASGVYLIEPQLLDHWFLKAMGVTRAPDDMFKGVEASQPQAANFGAPYPVVEQTKTAEEGDFQGNGDVETPTNVGVLTPEMLEEKAREYTRRFEERDRDFNEAHRKRSEELDARERAISEREGKLAPSVDAKDGPVAPPDRPEAEAARSSAATSTALAPPPNPPQNAEEKAPDGVTIKGAKSGEKKAADKPK